MESYPSLSFYFCYKSSSNMSFGKKVAGFFGVGKEQSPTPPVLPEPVKETDCNKESKEIEEAWRMHIMNEVCAPRVADSNFITLFNTIPEVFFPIDFIARRIAGAHFEIRRYSDDSIVYCTGRNGDKDRMNAILMAPNCIQRWREVVYMHHVYKLATGNAFMRAPMADAFKDSPKWKYCKNFWSVPSNHVKVLPPTKPIPMFGVGGLEDFVSGYQLLNYNEPLMNIPTWQMWHDRDGMPSFITGLSANYLKSESRLSSLKMPMGNLLAVYEARNVIYVKRGALGFIVAKRDGGELGTQAMKPSEKEELVKDLNGRYGFGDKKMPVGITDVPLEFVRLNLSINELQPLEENLQDAITIAGAYGIPSVLVPRKDQSTFSNQNSAEKAVYTSVIIPMANQFCEDLTLFLGLDINGYYVTCNFNDVDCLQVGLKEAEQVKKMVNERYLSQFNNGLVTYNDWRGAIHEAALPDDIFNKTKFEMTPEELQRIESIIKPNSQNTSTGKDNGRDIEENPVSDQNG